MPDRSTSVEPSAGSGGAPAQPDPRAEIAQLREENDRLRELLVVRDTELGAMRGKLTELEQYSAHLTSLVHRVRSRITQAQRLLRKLAGRGTAGD